MADKPDLDYITWIRQRVGTDLVFMNFAVGCVFDDNGRLLLQHRADDGQWGLPGGAMELGESAEEAVVREINEETGLTVTVDYLLGVYTRYQHTYPNGDRSQPIGIFFVCHADNPEALDASADPDETLALRFVPLDEVPVMANQQYNDVVEDLRAGRRGVHR